MNVYRYKKDNKLYTIDHLINDYKFTNNNERAGIYVTPYKHDGYTMYYFNRDIEKRLQYVEKEFDKEFEIRKL